MITFTKQERAVLTFLAFIIFAGSLISYAFKRYPPLKDIVNLLEGEHLHIQVDLNKASYEELISIPYIGAYTARKILNYRKQHTFESIEEMLDLPGIRTKNYEKFKQYLKIGTPP